MARRHRHNRIETVEKAMNLFWRGGYAGTSMRELESFLDMRPGSIYASFGNKERLYMEAMELYASKNSKSFQLHIEKASTFMEGLIQFIQQILLNPKKPCSCMLVKTLADKRPGNGVLKDIADTLMVIFENNLVIELEKARETGEIDQFCDIRSLARYIHMQIIGLRSYAEIQRTKAVIPNLLDDVRRAIEIKMRIIQ